MNDDDDQGLPLPQAFGLSWLDDAWWFRFCMFTRAAHTQTVGTYSKHTNSLVGRFVMSHSNRLHRSRSRTLVPSSFLSLALALAQRFDIFDMNSFCFILYFLTTCSSDSSFFGDFGSIRSVCVWVSAFVIFCPCAYNNKFSLVFSSCLTVSLCFVIWAELSFKKQIQATTTTTTTIPHHSTPYKTKRTRKRVYARVYFFTSFFDICLLILFRYCFTLIF